MLPRVTREAYPASRLAIHLTGTYKLLDLFFGLLPIAGTVLLSLMREDSGPWQLWLNIVSAHAKVPRLRADRDVARRRWALGMLLRCRL